MTPNREQHTLPLLSVLSSMLGLPRRLARGIIPAGLFLWPVTAHAVDAGALHCLSQTVYFEAGAEPRDGQVLVAQVVLQRIAAGRWRDTVCGVVHQGRKPDCQFSWWCDGKPDVPADLTMWWRSQDVAVRVMGGERSVEPWAYRATCFRATWAKHTVWEDHYEYLGRTGDHLFWDCTRRIN